MCKASPHPEPLGPPASTAAAVHVAHPAHNPTLVQKSPPGPAAGSGGGHDGHGRVPRVSNPIMARALPVAADSLRLRAALVHVAAADTHRAHRAHRKLAVRQAGGAETELALRTAVFEIRRRRRWRCVRRRAPSSEQPYLTCAEHVKHTHSRRSPRRVPSLTSTDPTSREVH